METEDRGRVSELAARSSQATIIDSVEDGSSKRDAEAELYHEVPVEEVNVEAVQVKYPIFDWEDMLKIFDMDDLVMQWNLVKERFSSTKPTDDKERALWVKLKRLFEPNTDDTLWKLQRYMHDPLKWRLYDTCGVHHVSTERGIDIFMLAVSRTTFGVEMRFKENLYSSKIGQTIKCLEASSQPRWFNSKKLIDLKQRAIALLLSQYRGFGLGYHSNMHIAYYRSGTNGSDGILREQPITELSLVNWNP
ncbi:hypothetical protein Tco_0806053 [Tanacetum coccineum]